MCIHFFLADPVYIFTEQFDLRGKHFRNEIFTLLRCCAAPIGSPLPTFRDSISIPKRRLSNYQLTLRNLPEELTPSLHRDESLKSDISDFCSGHFQVSTRPGNRLSFFRFFIHFLVPAGKYRDRDVNCNSIPATYNLLRDINHSIFFR